MNPTDLITNIAGKSVLFVMAVDAEYGPHLRTRFTPLMTGVGPVEAAMVLSSFLTHLDAQNALPDLVISLGSAGSRHLEHTGVYQVSAVSYRDMDATAIGFEKGVTPLLDLPAVLDLPITIEGIPSATLATGASVVTGSAYDTINADMVDMETYALFRACTGHGTPMIGLRGISDGHSEVSKMADWTEYLHIIDEKLAASVDIIIAAIAAGKLNSSLR
ncbi:MAG: 5'-methylthioadenosine/S-adenosylhomocysteine nucleosidase [Rhizobiaceae bacterium]